MYLSSTFSHCVENNMAVSPKDKFEAAVKVIQSLPKDGKHKCVVVRSMPLCYCIGYEPCV